MNLINNKSLMIICLLIVILFYLQYNSTENFASKYVANEHIYLGRRRDGYDLLDDSLFRHVITYENDDNPYEVGGKLGIHKCIENCPGRCVEFGVTGVGYCFPSDKMEEIGKKSYPEIRKRHYCNWKNMQ